MNWINMIPDDTVNGPGIRVSLWIAGCELHCKGCHNPQSWDYRAGRPFNTADAHRLFSYLDNPYVSGLTLSGGDPLAPGNIKDVEKLLEDIQGRFGETKTVWVWTGQTFEHIRNLPILSLIDVLVDGPYIEKLRSLDCRWRGSTNQRLINVPISLAEGKTVELFQKE